MFCRALRHVHHRRCHSFALVFSLTGQLVSTNIASGAHALTEERVVVIAKEAVIKVPWAPKSLHLPDPLHAARTTTINLCRPQQNQTLALTKSTITTPKPTRKKMVGTKEKARVG